MFEVFPVFDKHISGKKAEYETEAEVLEACKAFWLTYKRTGDFAAVLIRVKGPN